MNLATRIGLGAGLAGGLLIATVLSTSVAALVDNLGPRRLASAIITCPDDDDGVCFVEVRRVRPLNAQAQAEAEAAGLQVSPVAERILRRQVARNVLTTFLQNNTTAAP